MLCNKEIKNKINSIKNTKKITQAMETISNIKLKKNQLKINSIDPYFSAVKTIVNHLKEGNLEFKHSFLESRKIKTVGVIIISSNKGLCSSLNTNLFKKIVNIIKNYKNNNINVKLSIYGEKALTTLNPLFKKNILNFYKVKENFTFSQYKPTFNCLLQEYTNKKIDKIFIAYNKYKNTIFYNPTIMELLPLKQNKKTNKHNNWDYIYEPHNTTTLDILLRHYIQIRIYKSILSNISSEYSARMLSMKTANDNSKKMIKDLELEYNKSRQSNITQELVEIISGASAITLD